jgi:outer membrane lipoprotein
MNLKTAIMISFAFLLSLSSCSVISPEMRKEAMSDIPLPVLIEKAPEWQGRTVIVGGIVLEARNDEGTGTLVVLQTPLSFREEPLSRDDSQGRIIVRVKGYVDPAVYSKGRRVTLAGVILGRVGTEEQGCLITCLELGSKELHLWPEYRYVPEPYYPPYYMWDDYFYDPFFYPPYPYPYRR